MEGMETAMLVDALVTAGADVGKKVLGGWLCGGKPGG